MRKIFLIVSIVSIDLSATITSCSKKDIPDTNGQGPAITYVNDGVLCTMGIHEINNVGKLDTLSYYFDAGAFDIHPYLQGWSRDVDKVRITSNSNNSVSLEKKVPYVHNNKSYFYFSIAKTNPSSAMFPGNAYSFGGLKADPSSETQFTMKRSQTDGKKFILESKAYPGYFLGTAKWKNATYDTETNLVFTTKPQEFFFMAN